MVVLLQSCLNLQQATLPSVEVLVPVQWNNNDIEALSAFSAISASTTLNALIDEALQNNLNLSAAYERMAAVQLQARAVQGVRFASLDVSISDQTQKAFAVETQTSTALATVSWELDVWGRVAALGQQSQAAALEQKALYRGAQYAVAAQVAQLWFDLIEATQQLRLARARIVSLENSLEIIEEGFGSGIRQALDVYSARAEVANNRAALSQRERQVNTLIRQFTILLGRSPSLGLDVPDELPSFEAVIPKQLSSALLERRPDLQAAAYAVETQFNAVNVAVANRLPKFSFTGFSGALNSSLSEVLSGNDTTWSLLGGVAAPVFRGGQLAAEQKRQQHLLNASIASYKQAALKAFQEVDDALKNEQQLVLEVAAVTEAVRISELAQQQALEQYISGLSNVNTWLQSQRNAFDRQGVLLNTKALHLKNRVALYLALGGDFNSVETR